MSTTRFIARAGVVAAGVATLPGSGLASAHVSAKILGEAARQGGYSKIDLPADDGSTEAAACSGDTARWPGGAGLVVGALGLGFGVGATMRARTTATTRSDQS